jgi:hypothetical protein
MIDAATSGPGAVLGQLTSATTSLPHRVLGRRPPRRRRRRDGGDGRLDLLGEDLLAAGVDGHRVPAQQFDAAVGVPAGAVPRDRVPDTVDQGKVRALLAASSR